ncbi:phosphate transport system regulatory protein PhoU [Archaeoglobales archaeon]|nr:MAG: phosphate transport system regulatory protein PhoU [Archaeoglobales archaeon]
MSHKKFHAELENLKEEVLRMGELAKEMLRRSVEALDAQDTTLAEWVISKKDEISDMDDRIEQYALKLLALYQPMANDLRIIACSLKMITYLTRIGRYGKDIANIAKELSAKPHVAKLVNIPYMADIVCRMIDDVLKAFETRDLSLIKDFHERDDSLDALRWSIFRECLTYMMEDPKNITWCAHYIMIAKYLERCGDNACKIAEKVYYMVTGERVEIK